jgi:1,6-anhydro-N-acetylmuramate kinase
MTPTGARLIVGCMTGTSLDGLDAALVEIVGRGLELRARLLRFLARPLGDLGPPLRALAEQRPATACDIARLALRFGEFHADAAADLLAGERADLIALHGQTVFHAPPASWQLVNPWPVAQRCRAPVVSDLRGADLAAGGQGAPITPLADWILFRAARARAIINLGGFCNITLLPGAADAEAEASSTNARVARALPPVEGFDVCACNHVLDGVARAVLDAPFDRDGAAAAAGVPHAAAAEVLHRALRQQRHAGRSLGTGDEAAAWIEAHRSVLSPTDLAASAVDALARTIADAVRGRGDAVVAGGGARNVALVTRLSHRLAAPVLTTADLSVPIHAREAVAIAVLAALAEDSVPITLEPVTHRSHPPLRAGAWIRP